MAGKGQLNELFKPTEPEPQTAETAKPEPQAGPSGPPGFPFATGNITSTGIGLRAGEMELLDKIAAEWGVGRNFVARWLVICGLRQYLAGKLPEPPRKLP